jgi:hypothetical protein
MTLSNELGDFGIDIFRRSGRRPTVDDLTLLVDQELLKVPLRSNSVGNVIEPV